VRALNYGLTLSLALPGCFDPATTVAEDGLGSTTGDTGTTSKDDATSGTFGDTSTSSSTMSTSTSMSTTVSNTSTTEAGEATTSMAEEGESTGLPPATSSTSAVDAGEDPSGEADSSPTSDATEDASSTGDPMTDPAWRPLLRIGHDDLTNEVGNYNPKVAVAPNGDAFVAFYDNGVWVRRYDAGADAWDDLVEVSESDSQGVNPLMVADAEGNAAVAWYSALSNGGLALRRYVVDQGWGVVETVAEPAGTGTTTYLTGLAMSPAGHIVVGYYARNWGESPEINTAWLRVWQRGEGWHEAERLGDSTAADSVAVGIGEVGPAIRVVTAWVESNTALDVLGAVYTIDAESGMSILSAPVPLEQTDEFRSLRPMIGVDAEGTALVAFEQSDRYGQQASVVVNRYDGAWSGATAVNTNAGATSADLAVSRTGEAMLVWRQCSPCGIWGRRFESGAWQPAAMVAPQEDSVSSPRIALDDEGNAFALWIQNYAAVGSVYTSRYVAGSGWDPVPTPLEDEIEEYHGATLDIAVSPSGHVAVAAWVRETGDIENLRRKIVGSIYR